MEKVINDFSWGLFIWQVVIILVFLLMFYVLYKFGKVLYRYLKKNS